MSHCRGVLFACVFVLPTAAAAHISGVGTWSLMPSRDELSAVRGYALDANAAVLIVNVGLSLRHWEKDVTGWNGRRHRNEAVFYTGIGLLNLIQVQRGFSNAGGRTRIRSDIVLSDNFPFPTERDDRGRFNQGIAVSPFIEIGSGRKVYGIGIGLAFH
jgi:hypothetical protein